MSNKKDNVQPIPEQPPMQMQPQQITAFVVPTTLFSQMVEAIRGNVCHRDAAPIMDQVAQLQPQQISVRND